MNITPMRLIVVAALTLLFVSIIDYARQEPITVTVDIPVPSDSSRPVAAPVGEEPLDDGIETALSYPAERRIGRAETGAQATVEMIDELVELAGGSAGSRWVSCEESRCAAFMVVEGVSLRKAGDAGRELRRRGSLPFALAFEDTALGRVTFAFGDRDLARREYREDSKASLVSEMMESGIDEEEAWDFADQPVESIRFDSVEEMNEWRSARRGGAQD